MNQKPIFMKLLLSLLILFSISFYSNAESTNVDTFKAETTVQFDKRKRKQKRINKKRKRKCHQFGRKVYAG